jgi:sugar-specific transcriptional regulator TrmB
MLITMANYRKHQDEVLKTRLETELIALRQEKAETQGELQKLRSMLEEETRLKLSLGVELDNLKNERDELSSSLAYVTEELDKVKEEKAQLEGEMKELKARLEKEIEISHNFAKEAGKNEAAASLEKRLARLEEAIETKPVTDPPAGELLPEPVRSGGKVLFVDKKNDFVVIDIGEDDGVKLGDTFRVHNGDNYKGKINVNKISKNRSIGYIIDKSTGTEIIEGDEVE